MPLHDLFSEGTGGITNGPRLGFQLSDWEPVKAEREEASRKQFCYRVSKVRGYKRMGGFSHKVDDKIFRGKDPEEFVFSREINIQSSACV